MLYTEDLILRQWSEADIDPLARLNSDPRVMEYFLTPLSYEQSVEFYNRIQQEFTTHGFSLYAVELRQSGDFIGFVGLHNITFDVDFAPAVEIGWRLLPEFWGRGYATQAAIACLKYAADELSLKEIYSFTSILNKRSERVMQKIGMTFVKEFDHPSVSPNHPLHRHTLYHIVIR